MKCRYVAGMVALSLCLGAFMARAQQRYYSYLSPDAGPYFRLGIGPSFFQNGQLTQYGTSVSRPVDYDTGLAFDAAFGWAFNKYAAVGLETGYIGATINSVPGFISDNTRLYSIPFLVNFTFSYPIRHTIVTPYIGAGVGGADMIFDTDQFGPSTSDYVAGSADDVVFAGQAFAGLRFQLNRQLQFDVGYKFFATGDPTFTRNNFSVGFQGVRTHSIMFGLVWKF